MLAAALPDCLRAADPTAWLELKDGDRVVFLGNTFLEREGRYGILETLLTARYPDLKLTFRNLGWSGDTVWGEARAYFGKPEDGYKHMQELLVELKPTMIFVAYGNNEAHAGNDGVQAFDTQLRRLCDDLEKHTKRIMFIEPIPYAAHASFDPAEYNEKLKAYAQAIKTTAVARGYAYLPTQVEHDEAPLAKQTYDGVHFDKAGYQRVARVLPPLQEKLRAAPELIETLRQTIVAKNELFFHRWRPQNQTYLFGFRKHEQGQNAKEIAEFDPLIAEKEQAIAALMKAMSRK